MTYTEWFDTHSDKHSAIMEKLSHLSDLEVIEYFRFDNMVMNEKEFCPLYPLNKKCHDMAELNCYLCACPNFRFNDSGFKTENEKILYSTCAIDSSDGDQFIADNAIHQNCSGCLVPHHEGYIRSVFDRSWRKIMAKSPTRDDFRVK